MTNVYEFGSFRLDTSEGLLLRDGAPVPLMPKSFDMLRVLVENRGRLLQKDELMRLVWPDSFVEEGNLSHHIFSLRKALGDDKGPAGYIETVPKRGYRFVAAVREVGHVRSARSDRTPTRPRTLAVLPFKPLIASNRDEWLEWGIAETLITRFSGVPGIVVRPISATRRFSSVDQDPTAAGRQLDVDVVLDGSIQRSSDRIRVTVRLIRTEDGAPVWARAFDERVADIFSVQDSIAEQVAAALVPQLTYEAGSRRGTRGTKNAEAYQLYLRARHLWTQRTTDGLRKAIEYFNQAIETDRGYALAYAGLADCYQIRHDLAPHERMPEARSAALKALQLDPELAEAHVSLAGIREFYEWDRAGAERELRRAIDLDPGSAEAYRMLALQLMVRRRFDDAEQAVKQAQELEPLSVTVGKMAAWLAFHRRQYGQAITLYRGVLELDPHFSQAQREIGLSYLQNGEHSKALAALRASLELSENYFRPTNRADLAHAYAISGDQREAKCVLAGLLVASPEGYVDPSGVAIVYVGLGDKEAALEWLRRAYAEHSYWLSWLGVDPRWDPLRSDLRFREIEHRVGVAPK